MKKIQLLFSMAMLCAFPAALKAQIFTQGDIYLMRMESATHDSTVCHSTGMVMYDITISNSSLNDTVKIVDMNSQTLIHTEVNTTGATSWNFMYMAPLTNSYYPDHQLTSNYAVFTGPMLKVISDVDTIYNINNNFNYLVADPCQYGTVSGRVYIDHNGDCQYNTGDQGVNGLFVQNFVYVNMTTVQSNFHMTDTGGNYFMPWVQESWMTSYDVSIPSDYQFIFPLSTCNPGSYTFNTLPQINVDFALECTSNIDLAAGAGSNGTVRVNTPFYMDPYAANTGCDTVGGTLTLVKDPLVSYDALLSTYPADYVGGDTLKWYYAGMSNVSNGPFWNSFMSSIHLTPDPSLNIGDSVCFRVYTDMPVNDIDMTNNDHSFCLQVVNSYDPNIKEVSPKGEGVIGGIPPTTDKLTYTIHFQNTGNAPAFNVSILDTLDADLDLASFKIIGSSHLMSPQWVAPGIVKFNFNNIMLPDSGSNEAASHGYVTYQIDLNAGLNIGTQIKNTAHIFFDSNPAIVTNTALNTIAWPASVSNTNAASGISVYPNPASDNVYIQGNDKLEGTASISDISGKLISSHELNSNTTRIDVSKLPAGVYLLKVVNGGNTEVRKFVKQ